MVAAWAAGPTLAAVDITLSVSPAEGVVGRPMEVLLRTYAPIGAGDLPLPTPSLRYPVASGLWDVLYPIPDYPFDVVAQAPSGATITIVMTRDPADASLWRGSFTPPATGKWTIAVRNFAPGAPGAATGVTVASGDVVPTPLVVGIAALLLGLLAGTFLGISLRRRA